MQSIKRNFGLAVLCVALLATTLLILQSKIAFGNISVQETTASDTYEIYQFFATSTAQILAAATTTTATSSNITSWVDTNGRIDNGTVNIKGAKKATFYFSRGELFGGGNTGNTAFRVQVTPDGTNWYFWNKWMENATSTINGTATSQSTGVFTLVGTSTVAATMVLDNDSFQAARLIINETTDGSHTAKVITQY